MAFSHLARLAGSRAVHLGPPAEGRGSSHLGTGVPALDERLGGFPRGRVTELLGSASSGRTTLALHALRAATEGMDGLGALIDPSRTIFPDEPWAEGRLLVVRPARFEDALLALDALLGSAAFSGLALEAGDSGPLPEAIAVRVARLARETGTSVVACGTRSAFGSSCALRLRLEARQDGATSIVVEKDRQGRQGEEIVLGAASSPSRTRPAHAMRIA